VLLINRIGPRNAIRPKRGNAEDSDEKASISHCHFAALDEGDGCSLELQRRLSEVPA